MQDAQEASSWSLKTIKKKARDWWAIYGKLWTKRFIEYIILILLVAFVVGYLFARFDLYHTDPDSARYMLSALVQAQAAIVAIVVTLTLVAVQLTASAYSPRVIRIFRDNPDMWILLLFYVVSILYGLLVLKMIQAGDLREISLFGSYLEYHIFSAYIAVAFTFFMLFPYMRNIINLLNPATIINRLATEITKDTLLNPEEDQIQPIMDIVHGSIMKYDIATTRVGLRAVTDQVIELIDSDNENEVSGLFCKHLERVGRLAISKIDTESTAEVIENLEKFGKFATEKELTGAASTAVEFIEAAGVTAMKTDVAASWQAVDSLAAVGGVAAVKGLDGVAVHVARYLRNFGRSAAEEDEGMINIIVWALEDVGKQFVEYELEKAPKQAAQALIVVGTYAAEKKLEKAPKQAAKSLAALAVVKKELVDKAVHELGVEIGNKEDHDAYHKFMALYNKELEELRKEKVKEKER